MDRTAALSVEFQNETECQQRVAELEAALARVIEELAPSVEAICIVHFDSRYIATETVNALMRGRTALLAAAKVYGRSSNG